MINQFNSFPKHFAHHGLTTRLGGVSKPPFQEMNTSLSSGDEKDAVFYNISKVIDQLNMDAKIILALEQIHSDRLLVIDHKTDFSAYKEIDTLGTALSSYRFYNLGQGDGMITNRADVILVTYHADCVPILLVDEVGGYIANLHSGWQGTALNIVGKASETMKALSQPHRAKIKGYIGHAAGQCCYEVGEDVYQPMTKYFSRAERDLLFLPTANKRYLYDIKKANALLMEKKGVHIDSSQIIADCTICMPELYHSHRYSKGKKRGTMSTLVQKRKV